MRNTVLGCIITAILTAIVTQMFNVMSLEINKLDLHTTYNNDYISKPKFPNSKVELSVKGTPRDKLGIVSLSLVNFSAKAFNDQQLIIKVTPSKNEDIEILGYSAKGINNIYDIVKDNNDSIVKTEGTSHIFDFNIDYINRTEEPKEAFILDILYEGKLLDNPLIEVTGKDIIIREYDSSNRPDQQIINVQTFSVQILIFILIGAVFLFIVWLLIMPIISLSSQKQEIKRSKKYAQQLVEAIKEDGSHPFSSDDEVKEFVANTLYKRQCNWYQSASFFTKWPLAFIKPSKTDHEY